MNVHVRVPATTANLGPGFDLMGMAVDLYNEVFLKETDGGLHITVEGEGAETIPLDESNLVYQVAHRLFREVGYTPRGLSFHLKNDIPVTRGLGSSSAAVVGGLAAANRLCGDPLSLLELLAIAADIEGHPDNVAPALFGGIVLTTEAKGRLHTVRLDPPPGLAMVAAIPEFELPTALSREVLPSLVPRQDAIFNAAHVALMTAALMRGDLEQFSAALADRLHQPYRSPLIPGMPDVIAAADRAGALGTVLSGAGPTMIAFTEGPCLRVGQEMQRAFAAHGVDSVVRVLLPDREGIAYQQHTKQEIVCHD